MRELAFGSGSVTGRIAGVLENSLAWVACVYERVWVGGCVGGWARTLVGVG